MNTIVVRREDDIDFNTPNGCGLMSIVYIMTTHNRISLILYEYKYDKNMVVELKIT